MAGRSALRPPGGTALVAAAASGVALARWVSRRPRGVAIGVGGRVNSWTRRALGGQRHLDRPDDAGLLERVESVVDGAAVGVAARLSVSVTDRIVVLRGDVGTPADAAALERAVADVSGVQGVVSYVDVRPVAGRQDAAPSPGLQRLRAAATAQGLPSDVADAVVRVVLAALFERLAAAAAAALRDAMPGDVRALSTPPRRQGQTPRFRRFEDAVDAVLVAEQVADTDSEAIASAVVAALRDIAPDRAADIAAVLPPALRASWSQPAPA